MSRLLLADLGDPRRWQHHRSKATSVHSPSWHPDRSCYGLLGFLLYSWGLHASGSCAGSLGFSRLSNERAGHGAGEAAGSCDRTLSLATCQDAERVFNKGSVSEERNVWAPVLLLQMRRPAPLKTPLMCSRGKTNSTLFYLFLNETVKHKLKLLFRFVCVSLVLDKNLQLKYVVIKFQFDCLNFVSPRINSVFVCFLL